MVILFVFWVLGAVIGLPFIIGANRAGVLVILVCVVMLVMFFFGNRGRATISPCVFSVISRVGEEALLFFCCRCCRQA